MGEVRPPAAHDAGSDQSQARSRGSANFLGVEAFKVGRAPVQVDPARMCELLVGLPEVIVLGVTDERAGTPLRAHVEMQNGRRRCGDCGVAARVKERPEVELVDLPVFGRQARLVWRTSARVPAGGVPGDVVDRGGPRHRLAPAGPYRSGWAMDHRAGRALGPNRERGRRRARLRLAHRQRRRHRPLGPRWSTVPIASPTHRPRVGRDAVLSCGPAEAPVLVDLHRRRGRRAAARRRGWSQRHRAVPVARRSGQAVARRRHLGHVGPLSGPYRSVFNTMLPDAV